MGASVAESTQGSCRVIAQMDAGVLSPFDANEAVHQFHNGISRKLYNLYSDSDPWLAVCRAHFDGVLTDEDFAGASDNILDGLKQFAVRFESTMASRQSQHRNPTSSHRLLRSP